MTVVGFDCSVTVVLHVTVTVCLTVLLNLTVTECLTVLLGLTVIESLTVLLGLTVTECLTVLLDFVENGFGSPHCQECAMMVLRNMCCHTANKPKILASGASLPYKHVQVSFEANFCRSWFKCCCRIKKVKKMLT